MLTLFITQWTKRLLGIPDYVPDEEWDIWESGDQLFHFSGGIGQSDGWKLHAMAGRGHRAGVALRAALAKRRFLPVSHLLDLRTAANLLSASRVAPFRHVSSSGSKPMTRP